SHNSLCQSTPPRVHSEGNATLGVLPMKPLSRLLTLLLVCATAASAQSTGAAPAQPAAAPAARPVSTLVANPAIWRVKGAHGTVYLFGSIHVRRPNVRSQSARLTTE